MAIRMIDYYVKNLPFDARQEIFNALEKINVCAVEKMGCTWEDYTPEIYCGSV